jgi:hypothetical protein
MKKLEFKKAELLTTADLQQAPVWEFVNDDELGETAMRPIKKLPVKNLAGRLVGTEVRLANGSKVWGLLGNVKVANPKLNEHFITLSVERDGTWFTMARYHDIERNEHGPQALAEFLGLRVDEVFPISYDISRFSLGDPAALVGTIEKEPREKLTRAQIIGLAVP